MHKFVMYLECVISGSICWKFVNRVFPWTASVFLALIVSRLRYALPSWSGFLSSEQVGQINAFLRVGFCVNQ